MSWLSGTFSKLTASNGGSKRASASGFATPSYTPVHTGGGSQDGGDGAAASGGSSSSAENRQPGAPGSSDGADGASPSSVGPLRRALSQRASSALSKTREVAKEGLASAKGAAKEGLANAKELGQSARDGITLMLKRQAVLQPGCDQQQLTDISNVQPDAASTPPPPAAAQQRQELPDLL